MIQRAKNIFLGICVEIVFALLVMAIGFLVGSAIFIIF